MSLLKHVEAAISDFKKEGEADMSALDKQVGGSHYKHFIIQPVEFSTKNKLSYLQGSIVKRICRYNDIAARGNNAALEDLQKIKHEVDLIIELEGWVEF